MTMTDQPAPPAAPDTPPAPLEVVTAPASQQPATDHTGGALDRAAEAAMSLPAVAGRDEFLTLAMTARILSLSGAAPEAVRNNPYVAFHVALVGRDLGISPSAALALIDVIPGQKGPQLSLSPQLLNGQIRRLGAGEILKKISTNTECVATAVGPRGIDQRCRLTWRRDVHVDGCSCDILGESEFTWADAQMAGLAMPDCQPGEHTPKCRNYTSKGFEKCNQGYVAYPKRMLWWRASGFAADDYFPEAGLGLYSPEELGAIVDDEGRPIDPASVELPDGYQPALPPAPEQADPADANLLTLRIRSLPETEREELRETFNRTERVKGVAPSRMDPGQMRLAQSLVSGAEARAKANSKGVWQPTAALDATARALTDGLLAAYGHHVTPDSPPSPQKPGQEQPQPAAKVSQEPETAPEAPSAPPANTRKRGEAAPEPTPADIEGASPADVTGVIADVTHMLAPDVDRELTRLGMHTEGELADRRQRLAIGLLREKIRNVGPTGEPLEQ